MTVVFARQNDTVPAAEIATPRAATANAIARRAGSVKARELDALAASHMAMTTSSATAGGGIFSSSVVTVAI